MAIDSDEEAFLYHILDEKGKEIKFLKEMHLSKTEALRMQNQALIESILNKKMSEPPQKILVNFKDFDMKGKTLIGTCGDCEFWGNDENCTDYCNFNDALFYGCPKDFGCIHWSEKEKP